MAAADFWIFGLGGLALLHAGGAAIVTRLTLARDRSGLWMKVIKSLTASTLLLALPFAVTFLALVEVNSRARPSLLAANALAAAAALVGFWVASVALGGLASLALRRLSPSVAASAMFALLVTPPMAMAVKAGLKVHYERTHWDCVHATKRG